jgi:hypothetical protein
VLTMVVCQKNKLLTTVVARLFFYIKKGVSVIFGNKRALGTKCFLHWKGMDPI